MKILKKAAMLMFLSVFFVALTVPHANARYADEIQIGSVRVTAKSR